MNLASLLPNKEIYAQKHLIKEIRTHLNSITQNSKPEQYRISEKLIERSAKFGCETGPELWDQIAAVMTKFNESLDEKLQSYDANDAEGMWVRWEWFSQGRDKQNIDLSILEERLGDLDRQILSRWVLVGVLLSIGASLGKFFADILCAFVRGIVGFLSNACGG